MTAAEASSRAASYSGEKLRLLLMVSGALHLQRNFSRNQLQRHAESIVFSFLLLLHFLLTNKTLVVVRNALCLVERKLHFFQSFLKGKVAL